MIDFACKRFDLKEIIKCSFGLTKSELKIMDFFVDNVGEEFSSSKVSEMTGFQLSTVQKALKKLYQEKIILRSQKNLNNGGYVFVYRSNSKPEVRKIIKNIIRNWSENVEESIDSW